ncbi:MAG: hypothetical protein WC347_12505 [Smithellaceae bacterium]|jgi:ATP-dependent exoDNAse (exonuclease V) beta subunit
MKLRMKVLVILWIAVALIAGCGWFSSEPDEQTIQNGFVQCFGKSPDEWTVADFKITNKYKKEINQEKVFVYEAQFKIRQIATGYTVPEGDQQLSLACGLVKRGNSWYTIR